MWTNKHEFTLINKTDLDAAKLANDKANKSTPEYGLQMTASGHNAYLCNIRPTIINADNTLCVIRGCHVMHMIKYLTLAQTKELVVKWQPQNTELL
jgi:hypothetical protein